MRTTWGMSVFRSVRRNPRARGIGTAIKPGWADHDRAAIGIEQKVDMPLEQPRAIGRGFARPRGTLAALNPLLRILPDKGPEPGQHLAFGAADSGLNRLAVKEQAFDMNNTEADMHEAACLGLCDDAECQRQHAGERPQVLDVFRGVDRLELGLDAGGQRECGQPLGPEQVADLFGQGE